MNRKILMGLGAVLAVVAGVAGMAAYEAHVINVTAHIENALYVHPEALAFGTVFPQEYLERDFTVELSTSFQAAGRVDDVNYVIKQKPKCECVAWDPKLTQGENEGLCPEGQYLPVNYATHECPADYLEMENLCQFLSKVDGDPGDNNDTSHPSYYDDNDTPADKSDDSCATPTRIFSSPLNYSGTGAGGWSCSLGTTAIAGGWLPPEHVVGAHGLFYEGGPSVGPYTWPNAVGYTYSPGESGFLLINGGVPATLTLWVDCLAIVPDATGRLSKIAGDYLDTWIVDLKVPPVDGFVGQDWPAGCPTVPHNDIDYGCDLWIEVTCISENPGDCPRIEG